jgi:hypothetical protein
MSAMIFVEAAIGAVALLSISQSYASLLRSMSRIRIADWRKGAVPGGVIFPSSIARFKQHG